MEQNKTKKFNKWQLVFASILLIFIVVMLVSKVVSASATNTSLEQKTIQFIYTGKLVPEQVGTIERLARLNEANLVIKQNEYFEKYGFVNYYIRMRSRQLFGR